MKTPSVVMVITCHNKQATIEETIKSALAQNYGNKSVVVVDDCSTDESWNLIRSFFKKKDRYEPSLVTGTTECGTNLCAVKVDIRRGLGHCKNIGVTTAFNKGDAYLFIDGDDVIYPDKVQKCVDKWLEDVEAIGVLYSNQLVENQIEGYEAPMYVQPFSRKLLETTDYIEPNYFMTKKAIYMCGKFDEQLLLPDYDMHLRASEKFIFVHIPEILSLHRITPNGTTAKSKEAEIKKSYEATIKRALARREA